MVWDWLGGINWGDLLGKGAGTFGPLLTSYLARREQAGQQPGFVPPSLAGYEMYPGAAAWLEPYFKRFAEPLPQMSLEDLIRMRQLGETPSMEDLTAEEMRGRTEEAYAGIPEEMGGIAAREFAKYAPPSQVTAGLYGPTATEAISKAMAPIMAEKAKAMTGAEETARKMQLARFGATLSALMGAGQLSGEMDRTRLAREGQLGTLLGLGLQARQRGAGQLGEYKIPPGPESGLSSWLGALGGAGKGVWKPLSDWLSGWKSGGITYDYPWSSEPWGDYWTGGAPT